MTEAEYRIKIDRTLDKHFNIDREVWSVCGTSRIDYVLQCKESGKLFGLEVKRKEIKKGSNIGKYIQQAERYSKLVFRSKFGLAKLLIFISPAVSDIYKEVKPNTKTMIKGKEYFEVYHSENSKHSNVNSLIGSFNIGEIRKFKNNNKEYFSLILKNSEVWRSFNAYGPKLNENNYNKCLQLINK